MPKDKLIYLGDCIRSKRKDCNLTQQELADQCGLAVKTIQDIEKGRKNPSYITLSLLIERLGISPNSLFPAKSTVKNELAEHVIGKLQVCGEFTNGFFIGAVTDQPAQTGIKRFRLKPVEQDFLVTAGFFLFCHYKLPSYE